MNELYWQAQERIKNTPDLAEFGSLFYEPNKWGDDKHLAWLCNAPKGELIEWASKIKAKREKDLAEVPDHLKYLYQPIDTNGEISPYETAELFLYLGDRERAESMRPSPTEYQVVKVTERFVYILIRDNEYKPVRLKREQVENGEGGRSKSLRYYGDFYAWDSIKADCESFWSKWDAWVKHTSERIAQELKQVESNGFRCAKCAKQCKRLVTPPYQDDDDLSIIGWGFVNTPYDNKMTCKPCRQAIFDEYWPK